MELNYNGQPPKRDINEHFAGWLRELLELDEKIVYLDADLMGCLKVRELWKEEPKRVFNCGIQEANMVGTAAGLFLAGYKPYIHSFTPFISRRAYDQIFISVAYAHKSVHLIGTDSGITATANGGTHMCFEDVALMRVIPGACVVDVTDAEMFHGMLKATVDRPGVTYFRTPRRGAPDIYLPGTEFRPGCGHVLTEGEDVTIVASGIMVATALEAGKLLESERIHAQIIDPITVKPLDEELILQSAAKTHAVVTAENANVIGGLGSAVADLLAEKLPAPMAKVGITDRFGQTGTADYLRKVYGLVPENIVAQVHSVLARKA